MALDQDIKRLARVPLLAAIEPDALRLIAFAAEMRHLRSGDVLFERGDTADCGWFVLTGTIELVASGNGKSTTAGPDTLIGEMALITETERPATAQALEAASVWKIPRALLHRVLGEFPESAIRLRKVVSARATGFARELEAVRERGFQSP